MKILKKIKRVLNNSYMIPTSTALDSYAVLLEAGQGKNINGNMFAILKVLEEEEKWKEYIPYFVVTADTKEKAEQRFKFYGFKKVKLVVRDTEEYWKTIYTCKYLMTDNSFPPAFKKKEGQVYLNTWHGTPLKHLGRSDIKNAVSLGNVQKNYYCCDYALFPNEHTRDVFMKDYMLERMFKGDNLLVDYPRNVALLDEENGALLREKLHLTDKKLFAYMPTWRGTGRIADGKEQIAIIKSKLDVIEANLKENEILYVNLHFLVSEGLDFASYKKIRPFPGEYETYEFLNICDVLITDYSSVFFDFAVTDKKIILFAYDKQEYLDSKGMYMDIHTFPFPIVEDTESLIRELHNDEVSDRTEFQETYCNYAGKDVIDKILELVINKNKGNLRLEKAYHNGKKNVVYHMGNLNSQLTRALAKCKLDEIDTEEQNITICFEAGISKAKAEWLDELPKNIYYYSVVKTNPKTVWDTLYMFLYSRTGRFAKKVQPYLQREKERLYPEWGVDELHMFMYQSLKYPYLYDYLETEKYYHDLPKDYFGFSIFKKNQILAKEHMKNQFNQVVSYQDSYGRSETAGLQKYNNITKFRLEQNDCMMLAEGLRISLSGELHSYADHNFENYGILVNDRKYETEIRLKELKNKYFRRFKIHVSFVIPAEDLVKLELQNKISFADMNQEETQRHRIVAVRSLKVKPAKLFFDEAKLLTGFLRYPKDTLTLTIRDKNVTDTPSERVKVAVAYMLSKVMFWYKPILLFEKNAARYEESASVVYEKLMDLGYKNAYFVLDKNYAFKESVPKQYRSHIIDKYSFKHYLCFFAARSFIGSESKIHAFELRPISGLVTRKLNRSRHNYIFLQHGVMYMVSLDAERRTFFKQKRSKKITQKTVVSSQLELEHFVDLGGYKPEELYLCGLPKFDRNKWNKTADKIVVMITWRPWEFIQGLENIEKTSYFKMLEALVHHIPEQYKEKLLVLPHPLIETQMRSMDTPLKKYIPEVMKYDDILKETKILITDYSSISYDAFYRGANVIFCWKEKDECIAEYGQNAKLMLSEELAFGDFCYDYETFEALIEKNYTCPQTVKHIENYRQIVNFHDGLNTDRLIDMLKNDEII